MAKKKKSLASVIVLLLLVAALGALYFWLKGKDLNAEPETESTVFSIQSKDTDDLTSVSFTDTNGELITLVKEGGIWYIESDRAFPLNGNSVNDMTATLGTLLALRELDGDSGDYGFDEPQNVISATYTEDDGSTFEVKYTVGAENSFNSGTYLRDDIRGKVYLCSSNPAENFEVEKNGLIKLDVAAADVEVNSTHTVTLTGADGTQNVITDTDGIEEFLGDPFGNIDCSDWVEYDCDEADMLKYGITKGSDRAQIMLNYKTTVSITDDNGESSPVRQETSYSIWFGDTLDDGSVYYTITDSVIVYKLSSEDYNTAMAYLSYVPAPETEETVAAEPNE